MILVFAAYDAVGQLTHTIPVTPSVVHAAQNVYVRLCLLFGQRYALLPFVDFLTPRLSDENCPITHDAHLWR
jgi:hypothetical protein